MHAASLFGIRTYWDRLLIYLAEFIPETIKTKNKKQSPIYGLGRNVNLFEYLRRIAYKDVLKYKNNKAYNDFYHDMFSMATMLNNHCNPTEPLPHNEIKQVCQSICKWTWRNFTKEKLSEIQSYRASKKRGLNQSSNSMIDKLSKY